MTSEIKDILENMTTAAPEMEDYIGEDGLLYCGKCHTPKEAYFPEGKELFGRDRHPAECDCQRAAREQRQAAEEHRRHVEAVENLKHEYISRLCRYPLLIIDDFGMERGTDYGLEQVFHVIDTRYRSNKPLIATTNRPLDELKKPTDTAHSRIYDRLLSMCVPIRFTGVNFRQETAKRKMETMKKLLAE